MKKQKMGKVKLRVREAALRLREFTAEQMVKATGFNQESVQSELRRMRQDGLLTIGGRTPSPGQRGAPPCLYRVTDDPEARLRLAAEVEDFFSPPEKQDRPTSNHYFKALQWMDHVETAPGSDTERESLLRNAEEELTFAWHEEGEPKGAVEAFIKCQSGRLEYLKGNYDRAEQFLRAAQRLFAELKLPEPSACAEYLPALLVRRQWEQEQVSASQDPRTSLVTKTEAAVRRLQESGMGYLSNHPMSMLFLELSQQLVDALKESMRMVVLAEAKAQVAAPATPVPLWNEPVEQGLRLATYGHISPKQSLCDLSYERELVCIQPDETWVHNSPDGYQYARSRDLPFVALNTGVGRRGQTVAQIEFDTTGWFEYTK